MRVLLVHGLGRTPLSMAGLGRRLRQAGHEPSAFGYLAWAESYARIRARLLARIQALERVAVPWVAIGHSLGGLLLRDALAAAAAQQCVYLIMLGTPNQPPRLAPRAARRAIFRWVTGECGQRLASAAYFARLPAPGVPYALLAGTRGLYGRLSPFGDEPNDGIVALTEARVHPTDAVHTFPVTHTFMMNNRAVQGTILGLLARAPGAVTA